MRQRGSDHRHEGRGPRCGGRAAADELRPLDALRLQRLAGNRALAGVIGGARRAPAGRTAPISVLVQRAGTTDTAPAPAAATTDEQALVRQWNTETGATENTLTDRLYFHRHPDLQGVALKPGTPGAAEWIEIRETVVRPALATPSPSAQEPAQPPSGGLGESAAGGDGAGAGDMLRDAAQAGVDLIDWAVETGGAMIDAVAGFLGVDREVVDAGDVKEPAVVVDVPKETTPPAEAAAPAHQRGDAYKNQRDNKSAHVAGDVSCSPTSFTMALIDLHGGDEEAVRARSIELIKQRGGKKVGGQTEELVIELLQIVDWPAATAEKPAYFWSPKEWAAWAKKQYGGNYYKDPNAQQYVASLYSASAGEAAETYANAYTRDAWAPVIAALAGNAVATAEGAFTSSGHVVNIVNADDTGVTINDPYGLWLKGQSYQITNGAKAVPKLGATDWQTLERGSTVRRRPRTPASRPGASATSTPGTTSTRSSSVSGSA